MVAGDQLADLSQLGRAERLRHLREQFDDLTGAGEDMHSRPAAGADPGPGMGEQHNAEHIDILAARVQEVFEQVGRLVQLRARRTLALALVDQVVRTVADDCTPLVEDVGARIEVEADDASSVACSSGVLMSLVGNLMHNALRSVRGQPERRVTVRAHRPASRRRLAAFWQSQLSVEPMSSWSAVSWPKVRLCEIDFGSASMMNS